MVVALEVLDKGGVGRAYAKVITHASGEEFKPFFKDHISPQAHVVTDEWKGYLPLKKEYPYLEQRPSNKGNNFPELHIHIMNIQGGYGGYIIIVRKNTCKVILMNTITGITGEITWKQYSIISLHGW